MQGIKVKLYLNNEQATEIDKILGCCRLVYNKALAYRISEYENIKDDPIKKKEIKINHNYVCKYFHNDLRKDPNYDFLKDVNTKVIKQSLKDLDTAYKNMFKHGRGYPKFKSKKHVNKVRFPVEAIAADNLLNGKINLTRAVRNISFRCSDRDRKFLYDNTKLIKSVTITKTKAGIYIASFLVDGSPPRKVYKPIRESIGIDLGVKSLMVMSNGDTIDNPRWTKKYEKQLKKLNRRLSKKRAKKKKTVIQYDDRGVKIKNQPFTGSNREKARLRYAKLWAKITNKKLNDIHNITTKIVNENQVIILENLNVKEMVSKTDKNKLKKKERSRKLAKSIHEVSFFEIKRQLTYKAAWQNRTLITLDQYYPSSKTCSGCGNIKKDLTLNDRIYICVNCGLEIDRDLNAAINIEKEGLKIKIGHRLPDSSKPNGLE